MELYYTNIGKMHHSMFILMENSENCACYLTPFLNIVPNTTDQNTIKIFASEVLDDREPISHFSILMAP